MFFLFMTTSDHFLKCVKNGCRKLNGIIYTSRKSIYGWFSKHWRVVKLGHKFSVNMTHTLPPLSFSIIDERTKPNWPSSAQLLSTISLSVPLRKIASSLLSDSIENVECLIPHAQTASLSFLFFFPFSNSFKPIKSHILHRWSPPRSLVFSLHSPLTAHCSLLTACNSKKK